jgi:quinol monooxygenase YgiN
MIGLIAKLKVQEGKGAEFEAAFRPLSAKVNSNEEPGNVLYKLCKSRSDPNTYVVMELYRDQAAVDEHPKTKHFAELWPTIQPLLQPGRPDFEFVDSVD